MLAATNIFRLAKKNAGGETLPPFPLKNKKQINRKAIMTAQILNSIISSLAVTRQFYYSEADFQHSLALALSNVGCNVYLEYPIHNEHIDIILEDKGQFYAIELKYRTIALSYKGLLGTPGSLTNQDANDLGRYEFWKDVSRIEKLKSTVKITEGYVVMLTNDDAYWKIPSGPSLKTIDRLFKIHSGMIVQNVHWTNIPAKASFNPHYKAGRTKYGGFPLSKPYIVPEWIDYSNPSGCQFQFMTIKV